MATSQNPAANVDLFDLYFQRADLDRDGRISGAEAVGFFQGSGLPKPVLAQIWAFANPRQADFLGRAEFYNALKLVTVAQSNRQLTPEIVKAALYSPAAAKIPAPKINISATPQTLPSSAPAGASRPPLPNPASVPQPMQSIPALNVTAMPTPVAASRPTLPTPAAASQTMPTQGFPRGAASGPRPPVPNISSEWAAGSTVGAHTGTSLQVQNEGSASSMGFDGFGVPKSGSTTSLPTSGTKPLGTQAKDANSSNVSGNGFASDPFFGGDMFAATPVQPKQDAASASAFTTVRSLPPSPAVVPNTSGAQPPVRANTLDSVQRSVMAQIPVGQFQPAQSGVRPSILSASSSASTPGVVPATAQAQVLWPKMTQTDAQKYMKVFVEVDTDKDGKISGEQARNLFLSWRLPREVLKQVWDLSDQDNDSMLSFREFCVALYLMERYREGRPIPSAIPTNVIFDVSSFVQPTSNAGNAAWRPSGGFQQQQVIHGPGGRQVMPQAGQRPPLPRPVPALQADEEVKASQPKSRVPELEKHLIDQLSTEEQDSLNLKFKEATEAAKKVEELEKEILESRQKIEFFGTKMQELVLYKSRCDNRLNEIMERSSADKREVESLAKKYEEKYKQTGDVASKLTIEESTFRDIQEKKMELYRAILKMEQDGGAEGVLQGRAIQIQSDLDELVKALNERCKKYGLRGKPLTLTELPFGWQPGIQEGAADWDEDWDKFEDEGFTFVKELTLDVKNVVAPPKEKSVLPQDKEPTAVESPKVSSNGDHKLDKPEVVDERVVENGSHGKSEDLVKSAPNSPIAPNSPMGPNSPMARSSPIGTNSPMGPNSPIGTNSPIGASSYLGSPSGEFSYSNFEKTFGYDASPRFSETQSGSSSLFSGNKSFVEPSWGAYDNNDDLDSVWGFNASSSTIKDTDHERNSDNYFFGSEDFGLNPIKTGTSQSSSFSQNTHSFNFDDSVPSTPLYNIGNSPPGYKDNSGPSFDSFSRFDSFRSNDGGFPSKDAFARFDSIRSSRDFDQSHGFPPLDDSSDPFGSSGPFRPTFDSQTPRKSSDSWNAF